LTDSSYLIECQERGRLPRDRLCKQPWKRWQMPLFDFQLRWEGGHIVVLQLTTQKTTK